MADKNTVAMQFNVALQKVVQSMNLPDDEAMEIADLYPDWVANRKYSVGTTLKYGINTDGETQLWSVVQEHVSQEEWKPDKVVSLYNKVGFNDSGVPIWTQPLGGHDAYEKGDMVSCNGKNYISTVDNNVWQPDVYGWTVKTV